MTPRLTIAIPTFDRANCLRQCLTALIPQLTAECCLVVFDNASPTPAESIMAELVGPSPEASIRVVRNHANIGSAANVMRCLEFCETDWVWTLGDDDLPRPDAVTTALAAIDRHKDCITINFASFYELGSEFKTTRGFDDFIQSIPHFANLTLISNNLYRTAVLSKHVQMGYCFAYGLYPHLACVLSELRESGGACCFRSDRLIDWGPVSEWSRVMAGAGMGILLDLPMTSASRKRLAAMLCSVAGRYSSLAIHLLNQIDSSMDAATARHIFDQAWYRLYRHHRWMHHAVTRQIGRTMLRFPTLGRSMYRNYRSFRGDPVTATPTASEKRL